MDKETEICEIVNIIQNRLFLIFFIQRNCETVVHVARGTGDSLMKGF